MHSSGDQTGDRRPRRPATRFGDLPMLLILLAAFSTLLLLLATVQIAVAATPMAPPLTLPADAGASRATPGADSQSWIVSGLPGPRTDRIAKTVGAVEIDAQAGIYRVPRSEARRFAKRLAAAGRLVYAEPDVSLVRSGYPLDLYSDQQWWLNRIVSPSDVTPPTVNSNSPLIAVVEESLDPLHPDLISANLTGAQSLGPAADWHGTAVAGIIGSPGEMLGIRGVWPGARMQLFANGMKCSTASQAVTRAANRGAAVINMSYTFPAGSCFTHLVATQHAVKKGSLLVAASGNSGDSGNAPMRPALDPHVLSVGAIDNESIVASFSTRNSGVDLTAPGVGVLAPYVGEGAGGSSTIDRSWRAVSGTSFAAPMVSATAAWLRQVRPNLGALQISGLLTNSATDLGDTGRDPSYGEGLLSIERSLAAPTPLADPFEPNDDIRWINGSLLKTKARYLWRAGFGKRRVVRATLSRAKDPADVYRVLIPARSRITVKVAQLEGDVSVTALKPGARTIAKPGKQLIVRSNRPAPKTEGIVIRNKNRKPQSIWLAIAPSKTQTADDSKYRITVVRK